MYGESSAGGYGVAGRTTGNSSRAAVYGESTSAADLGPGQAAGVWGYSENGYGGYFETGQVGGGAPLANSGGLRVIGPLSRRMENIRRLYHTQTAPNDCYTHRSAPKAGLRTLAGLNWWQAKPK